MRKKKIRSNIRVRFSHIRQSLDKLPAYFHADDVHQLRVEIKKLKALLQLTASGRNRSKKPGLPGPLKKFYRRMGSIRSLQLQTDIIRRLQPAPDQHVEAYLQLLAAELENQKSKAVSDLPGSTRLDAEQQQLIDRLPAGVSKTRVRKFLRLKKHKIARILEGKPQYEEFHRLRKLMKTLQYNKRSIQPLVEGFDPVALREVTELLGRYCDACQALRDFRRYSRKLPVIDQPGLKVIEAGFVKEKNKLLRALKRTLPRLRVLLEDRPITRTKTVGTVTAKKSDLPGEIIPLP